VTDTTATSDQKTKFVRAKDIILACLTDAGRNLPNLPTQPTLPVVRTAVRYLDENNCTEQAHYLRKYARENWNVVVRPGRGRNTPESGDTREYRVQNVQGSLFIRLPVSSMGVQQGDSVEVTFKDGTIVVNK
jgi:hypothetical protein